MLGKKTGGRKRGTPNRRTANERAAIRQIARSFVDDPAYREALKARLVAGEAGAVELFLWSHAYGRPPLTSDAEGELPVAITIHF